VVTPPPKVAKRTTFLLVVLPFVVFLGAVVGMYLWVSEYIHNPPLYRLATRYKGEPVENLRRQKMPLPMARIKRVDIDSGKVVFPDGYGKPERLPTNYALVYRIPTWSTLMYVYVDKQEKIEDVLLVHG
jgi:hypothetical protein